MIPKNLFIFFLLIILILGIIFFWWPKYQEISDLKLKIKEKKIELQNRKEYFSTLAQLSQKLSHYGSELNIIDFGLPQEPFLFDLLNYLERQSSQSGLILERFKLIGISPSQKIKGLQETSLDFSCSGSYLAFKNFLSELQKSGRLIEVESISFSSAREKETFSFNLKIKIYSY